MKNKLIQNKSGITIIEILISITVLSIGILGLIQAFPHAISTQRYIELSAIASHLSQEKLEELASLGYDEILVGVIEDQEAITIDQESALYHFKRSTVVSLVDENMQQSAQDIGLKKIISTIQWPKLMSNNANSASLTTIVSKR